MSFRTRRVIFATPFYMLFEFFLLKYLLALITEINVVHLVFIAIIIGLIHLMPMFFEAKKSTAIGRFFSTIDGIWMWASLMFLIDIAVIYLIGKFVTIPQNIIFLLLAAVPILGIYNYYKAHKLVVNEEIIELDNLNHEINIIHLSDVHFGSVRHKDIINQISDKLKELEDSCDIAVISGDLADGSSVVEEDDFSKLKNVNIPIIFTPGNHDFYPGIENVIAACKNAGIIVLDNDNYKFRDLNIFGLTYSFDDIEMPTSEDIKSKMDEDMVNIINYHVPYHFDEFSSLGFDIQLSGHTHGGQFYPAKIFADRLFEYNMGLFKNSSGKYIHVTTGVGSMDTPMRWGTDSELVILKLKKKIN